MTRNPADPKTQAETKIMDSACMLAVSRKKTGEMEHLTDLRTEQESPKQPKDVHQKVSGSVDKLQIESRRLSATPAAGDHKVAMVRTDGPGEAELHELLKLICQDSFLGFLR